MNVKTKRISVMEQLLTTPYLGELIMRRPEISINDLSNLRVTTSLRIVVSEEARRRMESYRKSLMKRCSEIIQTSKGGGDSIYTISYVCAYNYYYAIVKLSFLNLSGSEFLDDIISFLQAHTRVISGKKFQVRNEYYRRDRHVSTCVINIYTILCYLYLDSHNYNIHESEVKHLQNKLLPLTIG